MLYPTPGFPIYESQIIASGAIPVALPLLEREAFSFDIDVLRQQLSSSSRLLILNSPHNPTGRSLRRAELEAAHKQLHSLRTRLCALDDSIRGVGTTVIRG